MIVLNLQCIDAHSFEGWFESVEDFDRQMQAGTVACPLCGATHVLRLPSGPRVRRAGGAGAEPGQQVVAQLMQSLAKVAANSEDVAERFPEEVRRIHYGETEARNIRGKATLVETRELLEEGIAVLPLPFPAREDIH